MSREMLFKQFVGTFALMLHGVMAFATTPQVKNVKAMQPYPWENKVYISYEVVGNIAASAPKGIVPFLSVIAKDNETGRIYATATSLSDVEPFLSGDTGTATGLHKIVWDLGAQGVSINSTKVSFVINYSDAPLYLVVDLSSGANSSSYPISNYIDVPTGGWTDEHKTTKLVLRYIPAGTYKMQNTSNVTLTKPFYMGIFEVTQKQYQLVMGNNPSYYRGDMRPVDQVSYNTIRGSSRGAGWPSSPAVDSDSFMGRLRARTGLGFDLPTEAQWEYACRAGTTSNYNNGGDSEDDLKKLGRYYYNQSDGKGGYSGAHTKAGSYQPNAWGLYDMHGNVWEWCLDWDGTLAGGNDPKGSSSGSHRVVRGGSWYYYADSCTSSRRSNDYPSNENNSDGFRLSRTL